MTNTIVVGVDGSEDSGVALDWAIAETRRRGADVSIVHGLWMPMVAVVFGDASMLPPSQDLRVYGQLVLDTARETRDRAGTGDRCEDLLGGAPAG